MSNSKRSPSSKPPSPLGDDFFDLIAQAYNLPERGAGGMTFLEYQEKYNLSRSRAETSLKMAVKEGKLVSTVEYDPQRGRRVRVYRPKPPIDKRPK